jgi:NAD(P)-dependent dehydrogenase (short-subunit alcohol dehydrogenase family)
MELKNKITIVTGAAMGIGKACAELFHEEGAKVIIADFNAEAGQKTAEEIGCDFFKTDISNEDDVTALKDYVLEKYGAIDILINNAALQNEKPFFDFTVADFRRDINVNLIGTFACIRIISEVMKPGSTMLNMLSVHYEQPRLNKFAYDASKAGGAMLIKESALALAERGITVNGISYGAVRTPMNGAWNDNPADMEAARKNIPLKWIGEPEEIARFAKTIITEFADCATGSIFTIDGGRRLK